MKYAVYFLLCCFLISCSDAFINHKLKFEKLGDCIDHSGSIHMISNINGERYEFYSCLDDSFNGKNYSVERTGDSIIVAFPKTGIQKKSLYRLILDIDAKPRYSLIIIDDRNINIVPAEK